MIYNNKIWVSGSEGRLGSKLVKLLDSVEAEVLATDKSVVDISNSEEVTQFADRNRPDYIINCSAITDPHYCNGNPEEAFLVNGLGARNMAVAANRINAKLIHLSTDDIFSGKSKYPHKEYDVPLPVSIYGKSKLFAEEQVRAFCLNHFIIRSSWIYGPKYKRVEEIIEKAKLGEKIYVPQDQYAAPTSANELAKFIIYLIDSCEYGTYHAVCKGHCSRKEFAEKVLEITGIKGDVLETEEVKDETFLFDYAVLDDFILRITDQYQFPTWEKALEDYIERYI